MNTLYFELSDEIEDRVKILESIPNTWRGIEGVLRSPELIRNLSLVAANTRLTIDRNINVRVDCVRGEKGEPLTPDIEGLLIRQQLPFMVHFENVWDINPESFDLCRKLIVGYLRNQYRGSLQFFANFYRNELWNNSARCQFIFAPWTGWHNDRIESGPQPARVQIEWADEGEYNRRVKSIVEMCRTLKLPEYQPHAG